MSIIINTDYNEIFLLNVYICVLDWHIVLEL